MHVLLCKQYLCTTLKVLLMTTIYEYIAVQW